MSADPIQETPADRMVLLYLLFAATVIVAQRFAGFGDPIAALVSASNDDITRFISLRAFFEGQAWADMRVYRVVPPEGLDLHWSRLPDLAMMLFAWPLHLLLPAELALGVSALLWTMLLHLLFLYISFQAAGRLFGPQAAGIAALAVVLWPVSSFQLFNVIAIDHHGLQAVALAVVIFSLVRPGTGLDLAIASGLAAGLSLAIGLEGVVPIALAGLIWMIRAATQTPAAARQLIAFAVALAGSSAGFYWLQTDPAQFWLMRCDALGPPMLNVVLAGSAAAMIFGLAAPFLRTHLLRWSVFGSLIALAVAASLPSLPICIAGPYSTLPDDVRALIAGRIQEARPALTIARLNLEPFLGQVGTAALAVLIILALRIRARLRGYPLTEMDRAAELLTLFAAVGVLLSFYQIRLIALAAPVIPVLMGYSVVALRGDGRMLLRNLVGGLATIALLFTPYIFIGLERLSPADRAAPATVTQSSNCLKREVLVTLNELPPSTILSPGNLSMPIVLLTDHSVLSAPYHRSAEALSNAIVPFQSDEAGFRATLARTGATHVVLCDGTAFGNVGSFAQSLEGGANAEGLTPIEGLHPNLRVFQVSGG